MKLVTTAAALFLLLAITVRPAAGTIKFKCNVNFFCPSTKKCVTRNGRPACVPKSRPGTCPRNDIITICVVRKDACTSDAQCKPGQKCCSQGCGRVCVPVCSKPCPSGKKCKLTVLPCLIPPCPQGARCVPNKPVNRPGTCPRNDIITTCEVRDDACASDAQCKPGQKCCSRGCGRTCVPVCPKPCPSGKKCKLTVFPCLIPPCPQGARCVPDKPVNRPGTCPRNDIITTCEVRDDACASDAQCKPGQKCCSRGCGRACVPVCSKPCPYGKQCKITVFPCFVPPCPQKSRCVPKRPVNRPGTCPPNNIITICSVRKDACTSDAQCRYGQKCCSRGCGRTCVYVKKYVKG